MAKQTWKGGNMLYPLPAVLVSVSDGKGRDNVFTVAWTGTVCTNPPMVSISVRPERYSYQMLCDTGEFVLNLTTEEMTKTVDFCGVTSGRDIDKFEKTGLHKEKADTVCAPLISESPVCLECKVQEQIKLGSHDLFLAKVEAVHADEQYMDENGRFCLEKAKPLVYSHGNYHVIGKKTGSFGYSIRKRKKKKNASLKK